MNAMINERLNDASNLEIIRDQISGIISIEMGAQYNYAIADEDPVADDYKVKITVENNEPLNMTSGTFDVPLINISVDHTEYGAGSSNVNTSIREAYFNIDCYQTGNYSGKFAGRTATIKAWKLARCVQKILDSDAYTYLLLRGIVQTKHIGEVKSGAPDSDAAMQVCIVRLQLVVTYNERAPQITGNGLEILPVTISDDNGQVVIDITEEEY